MQANGSTSDCVIYNQSQFKEQLENGTLGLPPPTPLPSDDTPIPHFVIGDDAFPLREWMMKPFSIPYMPDDQRIFNYRLSRARRVVERIWHLGQPLQMSPVDPAPVSRESEASRSA